MTAWTTLHLAIMEVTDMALNSGITLSLTGGYDPLITGKTFTEQIRDMGVVNRF